MPKKHVSDFERSLILDAIKSGKTIAEICKSQNVDSDLVLQIKTENGLTEPELFVKIGKLETENAILKKVYTELNLEYVFLKAAYAEYLRKNENKSFW